MESIIQIFRMRELSIEARIKIMKSLGTAINNQFGANVTEPLIYELVLVLDPANDIKTNDHYLAYIKDKDFS